MKKDDFVQDVPFCVQEFQARIEYEDSIARRNKRNNILTNIVFTILGAVLGLFLDNIGNIISWITNIITSQ